MTRTPSGIERPRRLCEHPDRIPAYDVRLYNRCPLCDAGPGVLCTAADSTPLTTSVHDERTNVRAWPNLVPTRG